MTQPRTTWFGVITEPGRPLALTIGMFALIAVATVVSILVPTLGSWVFVSTALAGAAWYTHMMRRHRAARRRDSQ